MCSHTLLFTILSHIFVCLPPLVLIHFSTQCQVEQREMAGINDKSSSGSSLEEQTVTEKKFGGIAPKKPLISKDHERAYFDSADWVLGKQAANHSAQTAIESLKPKLKRTPHHQLPPRKPTCASS